MTSPRRERWLGCAQSWVRARTLVSGLGLALLACGPGKPDVEVDGWSLARAALVDGESCYASLADTCIDEPAFVDAAIQAALDSRFEGTMPPRSREVEALIRSARTRYRGASQSPESLAKIAARVEARYREPVVDSSDPELVNVDLGALPGELTVRGRVPEIVLADSPLLEDFYWQGAEAGRILAKYAAAFPDKAVVRVELRVPKGVGSDKHFVYRYFRAEQRVAFGQRGETSIYVTQAIPGGLEAMAAGRLELGADARKLCSKPKSEPTGQWCPWRDPYAER